MDSPRSLLNPKDPLDREFWRALERCGLKPIKIRMRTASRLPPIPEPMSDSSK